MKEVQFNLAHSVVKSFTYSKDFTAKNSETTQLQVKNMVQIKLNPAQPTMAFVENIFDATDSEGTIVFKLETITGVEASTFVDNLDEVIKQNYMNAIMMAINEKISTLAAVVGFNIRVPAVSFVHTESEA